MDKKDILRNVYNDFFGIDKIKKDNEFLSKEIEKLEKDYPVIEINKKYEESHVLSKEDKDKLMKDSFERIDKIYIDDKSKELLKKIIEYMRKYSEQIEKQYIAFNLCLFSNNKETEEIVIDIIENVAIAFKYIKKGNVTTCSLYNVDKPESIDELYTNNNLIVYKNFDGVVSKDQNYKQKLNFKINENLEKYNTQILNILVSRDKEELIQVIEENTLEKFFNFEIIGTNPDVQDAYQEILQKLEDNMEIAEDLKIKLLDYISITYPNNTKSYNEYRDKLCEKILFDKAIPEYEKDKSLDEIFAELNNLVGLDNVKGVLKDLVNLIELKNKTKDNLKINNINLHMVFLGNPGTGKTTVARIIAEMLYNLKYIKQNKLIEASSKDLVAEYVGQTAPKTNAIIQKAIGGVLFIDEAYSLASGDGQGNSFNDEAIATLIQGMENYRDELVVIFAGYTKEMQKFLDANSGIVSRIGYTIEFKDYTSDELLKIFNQMMEKSGFIVKKDAEERVKELIEKYKETKNFGNARFIRNIYEKSIVKHASNTKGKTGKVVLKTITKEDISDENLINIDDSIE